MSQNLFLIDRPVELRRDSNGGPAEIHGYAAVYYREGDAGTEFHPHPQISERILPGAFERTLQSGRDVIATFDHNTERVLGRSANGTLRITTDARGLRFSVPYIPGDPDHELVAGKISRGLVTGASFTFQTRDGGEQIEHAADRTIRSLTDVELYELGPVSMPAYRGADAGVRSLELRSAYLHQRRQDRLAEIAAKLSR